MIMNKQAEWALTEWAPALATMYFTRRDDLSINFRHKEWGIDLVVDIVAPKNGRRKGGRMFGVQLRRTRPPVPIDAVSGTLKPSVVGVYKNPHLPFPVLIFYFTLDADEAYYGWVLEPMILDDGSAKLDRRKASECRKLDRKALDQVVEKINRWYDVLYSTTLA
jgi:hypothetical protein